MKNSLLLLALLTIVLPVCGQDIVGRTDAPRVIPAPQFMTISEGSFKLTSQTRIILGDQTSIDDRFSAQQLNNWLAEQRKSGLRVAGESTVRKLPKNMIYIGSPIAPFAKQWMKERRIALGAEQVKEGYILECDGQNVVIIGETSTGRFYGMMTLLQILRQQKKTVLVPAVSIRDWPQEAVRGITDDLSRGQISTMENFKSIIRFLAQYKLNVYSPYIEDIFAFRSHPAIGRGRGDLTAGEVKELDAYARQYHVELIPIFETLGHWENILALPEYRKYAEFPGAQTLNVSDEAVYTMLDEMIGELSEAFSSPWFNMAADESWDVGLGANKARVAASDLATVHAEHYKRLFGILRKYHKKPMMYGDVILNNPSILDKIPKDVVIVDWHYSAQEHYPSPAVFKSAGFPFVVSPAVWNFTGPFPNYINTMINIRNFNADGFRNGSLGLLTSNWNDYGGETLRELNKYGYAWTAECAWKPLGADVARFDSTFFRQFFGDDRAAVLGQSAYAWLSNALNQINWQELWRHPMLQVRQTSVPLLWRTQSLTTTMPLVQELLAEMQGSVKRNPEQVRLLSFVSRLSSWFAHKIDAADRLRRAVSDTLPEAEKRAAVSSALADARSVVKELGTLKGEFKSLWLETNRSANLNYLMMRYDRQAQFWEETIREVEQTGAFHDPLITSQWIYHPQANPGRRDSSFSQVPHAFFRRAFTLHQPVSSAKVQLIGDTHARLWVNGVEVGEVFARRSLSLIVEHERVKMWDVTSLMKPGDNVIAVEAVNYNTFGSAGVNIYGELRNGSATTKLLSDSLWRVSDRAPEAWRSVGFDDRAWQTASQRPYPFQVIGPNFDSGRLSWIER